MKRTLEYQEKGFWRLLEEKGIKYSKDDFPFLTKSSPPEVKAVFDFNRLLELDGWGETIAYLYRGLGRSLTYVGPVLDASRPCGFNDHTDRHVLWVSWTAVELLKRAGANFDGQGAYDRVTENLITAASVLHDLGNLIDRKEHPYYSRFLLRSLFTNKNSRGRYWHSLEQAVYFHDEGRLTEEKFDLENNGQPLLWALVLADKLHFGRDRIGGRSMEKGFIGAQRDAHILANLLVSRSCWYLSPSNFVWQLDFEIQILEKFLAGFSKKKKNRVWVTEKMHNLFQQENILYRESFLKLFFHLYRDRFDFAVKAAFALFPWVRTFILRVFDNDLKRKVGAGEVEVVRRRK